MALEIQQNVILSKFTTFCLGGPAEYFISISSIDELQEALEWVNAQKMRYYLLGGGSNTIFPDSGFSGVVLHMGMKGIESLPAANGQTVQMIARAGEVWDDFVQHAVHSGLSGVECLSGIPGQLGATPVQNVGAYGQEVSETIVSVTGVQPESGEIITIPKEDCSFTYRNSRFKQGERLIITEVCFRMQAGGDLDPQYPELKEAYDRRLQTDSRAGSRLEQLKLLREAVIAIRRRKSMVIDVSDPDSRSAGSFFTNPLLSSRDYRAFNNRASELGLHPPSFPAGDKVKLSAAWLVEHAGFSRGYSENGVGISKAHALALVNRNGTATALLMLADRIVAVVEERFGIRLEREPVVVL